MLLFNQKHAHRLRTTPAAAKTASTQKVFNISQQGFVATNIIYGRNQGGITLSKDPQKHPKVKHIKIPKASIRKTEKTGTVKLRFVPAYLGRHNWPTPAACLPDTSQVIQAIDQPKPQACPFRLSLQVMNVKGMVCNYLSFESFNIVIPHVFLHALVAIKNVKKSGGKESGEFRLSNSLRLLPGVEIGPSVAGILGVCCIWCGSRSAHACLIVYQHSRVQWGVQRIDSHLRISPCSHR